MYRHGMFGTKIHKIWDGMIQRCHNKNCKDYKNWGGRGIKVCAEWRTFANFYRDMGDVPDNGVKMSLGRINNNQGYHKANCRWETWKEQHRNRRDNNVIRFNGKSQPISAWAEELGINRNTLYWRLSNGWPVSKAFNIL